MKDPNTEHCKSHTMT